MSEANCQQVASLKAEVEAGKADDAKPSNKRKASANSETNTSKINGDEADHGPLYLHTKKMYDIKEEFNLSMETCEKIAEKLDVDDDKSTYARELKTMRMLDLPREGVEAQAKFWDRLRAGPKLKELFEKPAK